jgi:DNA-binding NarL/FixJ family response regulator
VLPAHASAAVIVAAIDAVTAGLVVLHPDTMPGGKPVLAASRVAAALSPREIEVLGMMADGLGNKIIAARLGISPHTVKFHVASIFAKLGAESRTEAVTIGVRQGVLMI